MIYSEFIILFFLAVVANWFSALAGGGAGLIQLPLLIFMGLPFSLALATHKIATVALGLGATGRHLREKNLPWKFILLVVVAGVPGVVAGVFFITAGSAIVAMLIHLTRMAQARDEESSFD